jgi:prepilin-type processing-associated H-X9-DG protein
MYRLMPYVRNKQLYKCPSDTGYTDPAASTAGDGKRWWSYCYNALCGNNGTHDSYFEDPSNTIIFFDGEEDDMGVEDDGDLPSGDTNNLAAYRRHNDGCNHMFYDGHAKWYKVKGTKANQYTLAQD